MEPTTAPPDTESTERTTAPLEAPSAPTDDGEPSEATSPTEPLEQVPTTEVPWVPFPVPVEVLEGDDDETVPGSTNEPTPAESPSDAPSDVPTGAPSDVPTVVPTEVVPLPDPSALPEEVPDEPETTAPGPSEPSPTQDAPSPPTEEQPVRHVDDCGPQPVKPDGSYWSCTLVDEFMGTEPDPDVWTALTQPGRHGGGACMLDDPRTVAVEGGALRLTVRPVEEGLTCPPDRDGSRAAYASGSLSTYWKWSQQLGRFEARIKVAPVGGPGLQEAFWLWPDARYTDTTTWPASGEIDIVETYSQHPTLAIPFLHYTANDNGGSFHGLNTAWNCATTRGEWHTYTLEWTADRVEVLVDGRTCLVNIDGAESFRKRFIMSFTQLLGAGDNRLDPALADELLPATMEVDSVRVWQ